MANDYEGLMDNWKLQLIVERAKKKGFREHEMEDAQQEVVMELLKFQFDPGKSNGATERTVVTALIDKKLTFMLRTQSRRQSNAKKYQETFGPRSDADLLDWSQQDSEKAFDLREDMKVIQRRLEPLEKAVCAVLARGDSRVQAAEFLGISRHRLDAIIEGIADRMREAGFDECR